MSRGSTCIVLMFFAGGTAVPSLSATAGLEPESEQTLEEVTVTGQRLARMRQAIVEAENRFFARYNSLNDKDEFDILCRQAKRTGSIREERVCYPRIVDIAAGAEGAEFQDAIDRNFAAGDEYGSKGAQPRGTPASMVLAARSPEYKKNMLRLIRENPELRALVKERENLQRRYDNARKKR